MERNKNENMLKVNMPYQLKYYFHQEPKWCVKRSSSWFLICVWVRYVCDACVHVLVNIHRYKYKSKQNYLPLYMPSSDWYYRRVDAKYRLHEFYQHRNVAFSCPNVEWCTQHYSSPQRFWTWCTQRYDRPQRIWRSHSYVLGGNTLQIDI